MKNALLLLCFPLLFSCSSKETSAENPTSSQKDYIQKSAYDLVNPFIGTGGHGHTFPGATLPFGMVQLSPDTRLDGWDGCSGYHYSDSIIYGFSHTHLSGTGVSDYGDLLVTPFNSDILPAYQELMDHSLTKSSFDKSSEIAHPGYYAVHLNDFDIDVELTATTRVGIHKYKFNNPKNRKIALNLYHRDKVLDCKFEVIDNQTIIGYRVSEAWATEQHFYFKMSFSEPFKADFPSGQATTKDLFRILSFDDSDKEIIIKVGISATGPDGASSNITETSAIHNGSDFNFEKYVKHARDTWSKQLNKIEVKGTNEDQLINFYTALYHCMIAPNTFSDLNGHYRGMDQKIHWQTPDKTMYSVFSLWDTFRGLHPLLGIIEKERSTEFINTFLRQYKEGGALPVWELACNETGCMIGYHAVPVILDYLDKWNIHDVNEKKALEAMIHSANIDHLGLPSYIKYGYIPAGDEAESVSKTLEYAYDDWCIAQTASLIAESKNKSIYDEYIARSQNYKNLFNPEIGFMQSKMNGAFTPGFDPSEVNFNFTEANSWQYSMFVPHDIKGMIELYGGPDAFEKKLDQLFTTEMKLSGRHQVDITGLIGQYAHGNEPSHHMAYLYNFVGKPWKTQEKTHQILTEQYWNGPDGLSGNEDCGQMSAWYVLSAMGFYSVTPGQSEFILGSPLFDEVTIHIDEKTKFVIKAHGRSDKPDNFYIQSAKLDGQEYDKGYIHWAKMFLDGGTLEFEMGDAPNKYWASSSNSIPTSEIPEKDQIIPVPYSTVWNQTFEDEKTIELKSVCKDCKIMVSQNGSTYTEYSGPITIDTTTQFIYYGVKGLKESKRVESNYKKITSKGKVIYESKYDNQYSAGGDNALIDWLKGSPNFRTGSWQGFQGQNVVVVVDQSEMKKIKKVSVGVLQDIKSWIFYPKSMKISVGNSLKSSFKESGRIENKFPNNEYGSFTQEFVKTFNSPVNARYIKIELEYPGDCPAWHLGNGGKAWVFVDEISIE
jgi:predicted alpha-1,2-mannosidase